MWVQTFVEYAVYLIGLFLSFTFLAPLVVSIPLGFVIPLFFSALILIVAIRCLRTGEETELFNAEEEVSSYLFFSLLFLIGSLIVYFSPYISFIAVLAVILLTTLALTAPTSEEELHELRDILAKGVEKGPLSRNFRRTLIAFGLSLAFMLSQVTFVNLVAGIICWGTSVALLVLAYRKFNKDKDVSNAWYLVPFFFGMTNSFLGILGGLIAWFANEKRNQRKARYFLVFGIVWTVLTIIIGIVLLGRFYLSV